MSDDLAKEIANGALGIDWRNTESAARRVAEYAANRITALEAERDDLAEKLDKAAGLLEKAHPFIGYQAWVPDIDRDVGDFLSQITGGKDE